MKQTVAFSKNAANIFFHIVTRCNLKCRHCYINHDQHGKNTLSISTIEAWMEIFAKQGKNPNIIFLGGEPTLHPDLSIAVKSANHLGYTSVTIDTNGYLFNDILSKVTPEEVNYFSFSLDGATQKTNDSIRGDGSYHQCISGIKESISRGFSTSLIYTVSSANIHELEMMPRLLSKLDISRFFIQVIGIRGKSAEESSHTEQLSHIQWLDVIPRVAEKVAQRDIIVTYPKVYLNTNEVFECAGRVSSNYFIFPNGRVYQCPLCEDYPINSLSIENNQLIRMEKLNESDFFNLSIPEGCVMNKLVQPDNICYRQDGSPEYQIACCLLKEEISYRSEVD